MRRVHSPGERGGRRGSVLAQIWLGDGQPPNSSALASSVKQTNKKPKDLWLSEQHHGGRREQTPVKDGEKGAGKKVVGPFSTGGRCDVKAPALSNVRNIGKHESRELKEPRSHLMVSRAVFWK